MTAPLEKDVERVGCLYAQVRGWFEAKMTSPSKRGFPDRIYIRAGRHVFVEWKRPGEKPTRQQLLRHRELRAFGAEVHVIDNLQDAYALFV